MAADSAARGAIVEFGLLFCLGIFAVLAVLLAAFLWATYNTLVSQRLRVREAWSGIDIQLKRRAALLPNLVEAVRGYASHEQGVFDRVSQARAALTAASSPQEASNADSALMAGLRSLFAVAEAYPDLKASQNFQQLQGELSDIEGKIAYARQYYNGSVLNYNTSIHTFPTMLIAGAFGFRDEQFFEGEESNREDPWISFRN